MVNKKPIKKIPIVCKNGGLPNKWDFDAEIISNNFKHANAYMVRSIYWGTHATDIIAYHKYKITKYAICRENWNSIDKFLLSAAETTFFTDTRSIYISINDKLQCSDQIVDQQLLSDAYTVLRTIESSQASVHVQKNVLQTGQISSKCIPFQSTMIPCGLSTCLVWYWKLLNQHLYGFGYENCWMRFWRCIVTLLVSSTVTILIINGKVITMKNECLILGLRWTPILVGIFYGRSSFKKRRWKFLDNKRMNT